MGNMRITPTRTRLALACALAALHGPASASCGAAFCMVNTNWNLQGMAAEPGWRLDLRYEFINQDQPMAGDSKIGVGQIRHHHDEVKTINRNYVGTLDYTFNDRWGVAVTAPVLDRFHTHIHNHAGGQLSEQWDFTRVGDVRVLGRYQLRSENTEAARLSFYGLNFGVKLPTGTRTVSNGDGDRAERSLQPGTGTTDLLIGGNYSQVLPQADSSWFIQGLLQQPLNTSDNYRPGRRFTLDAGYRYEATSRVGLMLQVNGLHRQRDSGSQGEPADSGGYAVYLSPGASYAVTKGLQVYGFIQLPVYQYVSGVQLTADWSAVIGISTRF
jgi:hypothetical protein